MLSANSFTSCAWHSVHFAGASFSVVTNSCTLPWHGAQAASPSRACTLVEKAFTSSLWQAAHSTLAILAGCGKSLIEAWQSVQPSTACALAAWFAGLMEMSFPFSDLIPPEPWHARHVSSFLFGEAAFFWAAA